MRGFPFLRSQARQQQAKPEAGQEQQSSKEVALKQAGKFVSTDILDEEISLLGGGNVGPRRSAAHSGRDEPGRDDVVEISDSQAGSMSEDVIAIGSAAPAADKPGGMAAASADKLQELQSTPPSTPASVLPQIRVESAAIAAASTVPSQQQADGMGTCMYCGCWALMYLHVPRCGANPDRGVGGGADGERFHCGQSWDAAAGEGAGVEGFALMPAPNSRAILSSERSSLLKRKRDVGNQSNGDRTRSRCDGLDTARKTLTFCKVEHQDDVSGLEMKSPATLPAVLKEKEQYKAQLHCARKELSLVKHERDKLSRELKMNLKMRETDVDNLNKLRDGKSAAEEAREKSRHELQEQQKLHEDQLATQWTTTNILQGTCTGLQEENELLRGELQMALVDRHAAFSAEKKAKDTELKLKDAQASEKKLFKSISILQDKLKQKEDLSNLRDQETTEKLGKLKSQQRKTAKDLNTVRIDLKAAENGLKVEKRQKEVYEKDLSKLKEDFLARVKELTGKLSSNQKAYDEKLASFQKIREELVAELQQVRKVHQEEKVQAEAKAVSLEQAYEEKLSSLREESEAEVTNLEKLQQATLASLHDEQADNLVERNAHEATLATLTSLQREHEATLATLTSHQREHEATLATLTSHQREHEAMIQVHADKVASLQRQEAEGILDIQEKHRLEMEALETQKNKRIVELLLEKAALQREKEAQAEAHYNEKVAMLKEKEAKVHQLLQEKVFLEKTKEDCMMEVLRQHEASKAEWQTSIEEAMAREQEWRQQLNIAKNESLMLASVLREKEELRAQASVAKLADACMLSLARRNEDLQKEVKLSKDRLVSLAREKDHMDHEIWDLRARLLSSGADRERLHAELASITQLQGEVNLVVQALEKEKDDLHQRLQCRSSLSVVEETNADMQQVTEYKWPLCVMNQMDDDLEPVAENEFDLSVDEEASADLQLGPECVYPECLCGRMNADLQYAEECMFPECPPQQTNEDVQQGVQCMTPVYVPQGTSENLPQEAEVGSPFCMVELSNKDLQQDVQSVYSSVIHWNEDLQENVKYVTPLCSVEPMDEDLKLDRQVGQRGEALQQRDEGLSPLRVAEPFNITLEQEKVGGERGEIVMYRGPETRLPQFSVMPGLDRISLRAHMAGILRLFDATRGSTAIVPHRPLQIKYPDEDRP